MDFNDIIKKYGGIIQPISDENQILLATFKNNINLEVNKIVKYYYLTVYKSSEIMFSMIFRKFDKNLISSVERTAYKISIGAYSKQKTTHEKIKELIQQEQLVSCMNQTKWLELRKAMKEEMPFPPEYDFKFLNEEPPQHIQHKDYIPTYIGDWDSEFLPNSLFYLVEWLKIDPRLAKSRGMLLEPEIVADESNKLEEILNKYNINYEKCGKQYIIYGYIRSEKKKERDNYVKR